MHQQLTKVYIVQVRTKSEFFNSPLSALDSDALHLNDGSHYRDYARQYTEQLRSSATHGNHNYLRDYCLRPRVQSDFDNLPNPAVSTIRR